MIANDLFREHYCSEDFFIHFTGMLYSEGVKALAEKCQAYWLIDKVASHQRGRVRAHDFQVWTLTVKDGKGEVVADDGNGNVIIKQKIPFTDFPYDQAIFWVEGNVILLPSEH
jgi:hypothetical protein